MARINSYPSLTTPTTGDLLICTDVSETGNPTKSLSIADLSSLIAPAVGGATSLNGLSDVLIDGTSAYFITIPAGLVGNPGANVTLGFNAGSALTTGNSNTLYGHAAGDALTTGFSNSAFGDNALGAMTTGDYSVAVGDSALLKLTGDNSFNTAVGYEAGFELVSGVSNTLVGHDAGYGGVGASFSNAVAIGDEAGKSLTTANDVVAVGRRAFNSINTQGNGVAVGFEAGRYAYGVNNSYLGYKSGLGSTTATNNTATDNVGVGYHSLKAIKSGSSNVAIGSLAGEDITTGGSNINIGAQSGKSLTSGGDNVLIGTLAGSLSTTSSKSIAIGTSALQNHAVIAASPNIAIGTFAGQDLSNTTGGNVMIGDQVMKDATTAAYNIAIGNEAGKAIVGGGSNAFIGYKAGTSTTSGNNNIAIGFEALEDSTTGNANVAIGRLALNKMTDSQNNTAVGYLALLNFTSQAIGEFNGNNTAIGTSAGISVTTGEKNTILGVGDSAGGAINITTGSSNLLLGYLANVSAVTATNQIVIGATALGHADNIVVIGDANITAWHPGDDNGVDLGSATYSFKDAYIQGVYYDTSGDAGTAGQVLSSTATGTNWIASTAATSLNGLTDALVDTLSLYVGTVPAGLSGNPQGNTTLGESSGPAITTGTNNTYIGSQAAKVNITGTNNLAIGASAMALSTSSLNTAVGTLAIGTGINSNGRNHAIGYEALENVSTGTQNTASGYKAGDLITTGSNNTMFGDSSGDVLTTGSNNIYIGTQAVASGIASSNEIVIGSGTAGQGNNTITLGTSATTRLACINGNNVDLGFGSGTGAWKDIYLREARIMGRSIPAAPASASASGDEGTVLFSDNHIYVCVADDTWKRVAIATF